MKFWKSFVTMAALVALVAEMGLAGFAAPDTGAESGQDLRRWEVTGPYGGSVRALVIAPDDPQRVYITTTDGQLYRSRDGGRSWARTIPGFNRPGFVLDNLVIDPGNPEVMYMGVWSAGHEKEGGLFKSEDGGDTWHELEDLHNQSIRAIAIDENDPNLIVVGSLAAVFRSRDGGEHFERISPKGHADLINFESVAIDPRDPNHIYAGTTHLPWKTLDGGINWIPIKDGMLDDSDVFSIAILPDTPDLIYASACSGIYKSENAGNKWSKVQGIPFSSRRTHVILPHPTRPEIVFAGTTQGLWRTMNAGKTWQLITTKTLVVNSIGIHPSDSDRVLLGTDEHGVLLSHDLGKTFVESNVGFIHRHVLALLPDMTQPNRVYATVYNDGVAGGFFISNDAGRTWRQSIKGLGGRDIFDLFQDPDAPDHIYAGTNYGVYRSKNRGVSWDFLGQVKKKSTKRKSTRRRGRRSAVEPSDGEVQFVNASYAPQRRSKRRSTKRSSKPAPKPTGPKLVTIEDQVNDFERYVDADGNRWLLAATNAGLYRTQDPEKGWELMETPGLMTPFSAVSSELTDPKRTIYLGTVRGLALSVDFGATWDRIHRGPDSEPIKSIVQDPRDFQTIYVGARGAFYKSADGGRSWRKRGGGLPTSDIAIVTLDPLNPDIIYAGDYRLGGIYRSTDKGESWKRLDSGLPSTRVWTLAADPFDPGRIYAGSFSGGVYVLSQNPQAVVSH